jgi:hypothetical protein
MESILGLGAFDSDRGDCRWLRGCYFFSPAASPMLGANCDNRYLYSIRSNRLFLGAEHWVGKSY